MPIVSIDNENDEQNSADKYNAFDMRHCVEQRPHREGCNQEILSQHS